jgi:arylsulfatase A-like enzyme
VDIAPTLLHLLGMPVPPSMTGRVIAEGLRTGPQPSAIRVERRRERVATPDGRYQVSAHLSIVEGRQYLDYTEVMRR